MILGLGIDLAHGSRIRDQVSRNGEEFLREFLSAEEIEACRKQNDPYPGYAARFAVKEALGKALGTGVWGVFSWHEVRVGEDDRGKPTLELSGRARDMAGERGARHTHVSLAHEGDLAVAVVVLEG